MKLCLLLLVMVLIFAVANTSAQLFNKSGNCPLRNTVNNCGSRCTSDYQCSSNQKCCPNKCGYSSCTESSAINTGDDGGYKGSNSKYDSNQAVYCNGVKCESYEKCMYDRITRRDKCTRA